ncbi:alpha,alpha-trehalose-phosphate synthase [Pseudoroseomonas rhizosphaerae]|uniref:Alpha,alpha-trehalose-phosphate synthase n=1 Tax=Teichococcus rhizosphaerae TaxID=1335062 RepID=A0A2C7AC88_9PROT|nr:HAD family hydrolase [Pseudoroseomonas rhizosphaerae]PHK94267.1 alpha,alpha-trehalose-phosphate synthase [Pseudoroseomonas rhizosphaerae]
MNHLGLILATDLDGTFLGGSDAQRRALYAALSARDDALLIFVTGRDIGFVRELVAQPGMPRPRYIIGDVGTSVFDGATFRPIPTLEAEIAARWADSGERVRAMLEGEPGLRPQPTPFRHRMSYYYDPAVLRPGTVRKVEEAGFDCILSADTFLDVLPRGIAKGPTLLRLVQALGLPASRVLTAGDTMNDLSLFQTGLKGVAVGNSEPRLVEALRGVEGIYRSPEPGAAGIADAIRHFNLQPEAVA